MVSKLQCPCCLCLQGMNDTSLLSLHFITMIPLHSAASLLPLTSLILSMDVFPVQTVCAYNTDPTVSKFSTQAWWLVITVHALWCHHTWFLPPTHQFHSSFIPVHNLHHYHYFHLTFIDPLSTSLSSSIRLTSALVTCETKGPATAPKYVGHPEGRDINEITFFKNIY